MRVLLFILLFSSSLFTQSKVPGFDLLQEENETLELDFQIQNGLIIVPIKYKNLLPLNFIFDTGSEHSILFDKHYNDLLGLPYDQEVEVLGSDLSQKMSAHIVRNVPIELKDNISVVRDIIVLDEDLMKLEQITGVELDGIIGGRFFNHLLVHINFKELKIKFYNPTLINKKAFQDYDAVDIEIINHKPYATCETQIHEGKVIPTKYLFDTGASLPIMIHHNLDSNLSLPANVISGDLGVGLGGNLEGYVSRIPKFTIGPFFFEHPISFFQTWDGLEITDLKIHRKGIIGSDVISRFDIYLDYLGNKLYLKPNKSFKRKFTYDKSGLILYAFGPQLNQFYVRRVIKDSPADRAGIREGDEIIKFGWMKLKFFTLEKITNKLSGRERKRIRLQIRRGEEKIKKEFRLKDFFNPKS